MTLKKMTRVAIIENFASDGAVQEPVDTKHVLKYSDTACARSSSASYSDDQPVLCILPHGFYHVQLRVATGRYNILLSSRYSRTALALCWLALSAMASTLSHLCCTSLRTLQTCPCRTFRNCAPALSRLLSYTTISSEIKIPPS